MADMTCFEIIVCLVTSKVANIMAFNVKILVPRKLL